MAQYPVFTGPPGEIQLYDTLQREFYWSHNGSGAHSDVAPWQSKTAQGINTFNK